MLSQKAISILSILKLAQSVVLAQMFVRLKLSTREHKQFNFKKVLSFLGSVPQGSESFLFKQSLHGVKKEGRDICHRPLAPGFKI